MYIFRFYASVAIFLLVATSSSYAATVSIGRGYNFTPSSDKYYSNKGTNISITFDVNKYPRLSIITQAFLPESSNGGGYYVEYVDSTYLGIGFKYALLNSEKTNISLGAIFNYGVTSSKYLDQRFDDDINSWVDRYSSNVESMSSLQIFASADAYLTSNVFLSFMYLYGPSIASHNVIHGKYNRTSVISIGFDL